MDNFLLYVILKYSDNYNCALVCKKWYNLIVKDKCGTCNKITNFVHLWNTEDGDVNCHTHPTFRKDYKVLDVEIKNAKAFKTLLNALGIGTRETTLVFKTDKDNNNFICIQQLSNTRSIIVKADLDNTCFSKFLCLKKELSIGIDVNEFFKLLRYVGNKETLTLSINKNSMYQLNISNKKVLHKCSVIDLPRENIQIPQINWTNVFDVDMDIIKFLLCKNEIWISDITENVPFDNEYEIKYFIMLGHFKKLCNKITFSCKQNFPSKAELYVENFGQVIMYCAPCYSFS